MEVDALSLLLNVDPAFHFALFEIDALVVNMPQTATLSGTCVSIHGSLEPNIQLVAGKHAFCLASLSATGDFQIAKILSCC